MYPHVVCLEVAKCFGDYLLSHGNNAESLLAIVKAALELQFALLLFAAKAARRQNIAISILILQNVQKC